MRIAYLDGFSGISGDMLLGALVHAGINPDLFRRTVQALGLDARIEVETVNRSGISSTKVHVLTRQDGEDHAHLVLEHADQHREHGHDHAYDRDRHHDHRHDHHHDAHGRSLKEIRALIEAAPVDAAARRLALRAFQFLGEAEAKIHNVSIDGIHFHELGATDAIVDIVCSAVGCVALKVDRWICLPLNVGGGTVQCAHGVYPVPAPATTELLKGAQVYSSGVQKELVTPTGAALLRALEVAFTTIPLMKVERIGYGAGSRDLPGIANVVRLTIGESAELATETVRVLETSIDDATPQVVGYVIEQALAAGALDAFAVAVQMKKSRPGLLLTVLAKPADASILIDLLLRETTTLGVRVRQEQRVCLDRRFQTVTTPWGEVRVKLGYFDGELANCAPEFEDCRRLAQENGVPLKTVMQEALRCLNLRRAASHE